MNQHQTGQVVATAAEIYEQFFVPALFAEWPPRALKAAGVKSGEAVLDVACGTGVLAQEAAHWVAPGGSVVGVDINEGMLAVARQKASDIRWKSGPAEALPFAAGSFDHVLCQFGLMFFTDQIQAIAEMKRVLRPRGKLTVVVWDTLANTPGYALMAELLAELFGPEEATSIEAPYSLGNKKALASLFTAAGVHEVSIQTVTGTARFSSLESWIYTDIKGWTLADLINVMNGPGRNRPSAI